MIGFPPDLFSGQRFAVVGLGRNGLPAAQALLAMGAEVMAWDDASATRDAAIAAGVAVTDPTARIGDVSALILSPGIPHRLPTAHPIAATAQANGVPILSDAELLYQAVRRAGSQARFVGVTGTNGKSTTTALVAHIAAVAGIPYAAGGNLGPAALALPLLPHTGVYALEMSSYMLERLVSLRFDAAAMLNLSPDHLDRHGDMVGYAAAKREIFARRRDGDRAVVGIDDAPSRAMAAEIADCITISGDSRADVWCDAGILRDPNGTLLPMAEAHALPGAHNAQNAAAAAALAMSVGLARDSVIAGLRGFAGLPHRQERVATVNGAVYVNDSKATNADAAARALGCYDRVIWIAGGVAKADGIAPLAPLFPRLGHSFLIGRDAKLLAATLGDHGAPHSVVGDLDAAVSAAHAVARTGDVVLLSPACASFDQFSGFDARGDRFRDLVLRLARNGDGSG